MGRFDSDKQRAKSRLAVLVKKPCPHCGVLMRPAVIPQHLGARRDTTPERFWSRVDKSGKCWTWTGRVDKNGYGIIWWAGRNWRAPRLAWELTNGPIPDGMFICHTCDNPPCVNPAHLFVGGPGANVADMMSKGRYRAGGKPMRGSDNGYAKLTEPHVIEIKGWLARGAKAPDIAPRFGVSAQTVYAIRRGQNWKAVA